MKNLDETINKILSNINFNNNHSPVSKKIIQENKNYILEETEPLTQRENDIIAGKIKVEKLSPEVKEIVKKLGEDNIKLWEMKYKQGWIQYVEYWDKWNELTFAEYDDVISGRRKIDKKSDEFKQLQKKLGRDNPKYWDLLYNQGVIDQGRYEDGWEDAVYNSYVDAPYTKTYPSLGEDDSTNVMSQLITYKTAAIGKLITVPYVMDYRKEQEGIIVPFLEPAKYHDANEPYNDYRAKRLFSYYCVRISDNGEETVNEEGWDKYYINQKNEECKPSKSLYWTFNKVNDKSYDYVKMEKGNYSGGMLEFTKTPLVIEDTRYYYKEKNNKDGWKRPQGDRLAAIIKNVDFSKDNPALTRKVTYEYPEDCRMLTYNECLRLSWAGLYKYGAVDGGVTVFKYKNSKNEIKNFAVCIKYETAKPWLSKFNSFFSAEGIVEGDVDDATGIKTANKCVSGQLEEILYPPTIQFGEYNYSSQNPNFLEQNANSVYSSSTDAADEKFWFDDNKENKEITDLIGKQAQLVASQGIRLLGK
jgi:hypothetical protein